MSATASESATHAEAADRARAHGRQRKASPETAKATANFPTSKHRAEEDDGSESGSPTFLPARLECIVEECGFEGFAL